MKNPLQLQGFFFVEITTHQLYEINNSCYVFMAGYFILII